MNIKNHDFGYGNEIPSVLDFLDTKRSYWNRLYGKIMTEGKSKTPAIVDIIQEYRYEKLKIEFLSLL